MALYICRDRNPYTNQKGNFKMKTIATLIVTLFAATVFAAAPAVVPAAKCDPVKDKTCKVEEKKDAKAAPAAAPAKK